MQAVHAVLACFCILWPVAIMQMKDTKPHILDIASFYIFLSDMQSESKQHKEDICIDFQHSGP